MTLKFTQKLLVELYNPEFSTSGIVIDGGNVFDLYLLSHLAQSAGINPTDLLEKIQISRAFTCYQLASLILEKLPIALEEFDAKIVAILNITDLFVDLEVPFREARLIFLEISRTLQLLSKRRNLVVIVCNPIKTRGSYLSTQLSLQRLLSSYSDDVIRISESGPRIFLTREKGFRVAGQNEISLRRDVLKFGSLRESPNPMAILPNNFPSTRIR